jgi:uncharacterized protein YabE (DUF348 family)
MKSKTAVLCGLLLITIGVVLFWANARRNIKLIIDGKPRQVATYKITVGQILKETGINFNELDRIFPEINYWMTEQYFLKVDHRKAIHLVSSGGQKDYSTFENLAGNILADGEVALYPGDQIRWNGTQIQPDFNLGSLKAINLEVVRGDPFELITDLGKQRQQFYTDATTVGEALRQTAVRIPPDSIIVPAEDTPFIAGMTIRILEETPLVLVSEGGEIPLTGYGTNAGELLASAGYPLQGLDICIPAEDQPLPADHHIKVIHVAEEVTLKAETIPNEIEWVADESVPLDQYKTISEGKPGLKGTIQRKRMENGIAVEEQISPEKVLVEPVKEVRSYGTQISIQTLSTPDGQIEYWRAVPVYATSYSPCRSGVDSCINGTASGRKVEKGVIAVDGDWYAEFAGLTVYVPDYGFAVIGDTGRSPVADNRWIDLAYNDENFVPWSNQTTLYFLTPVPASIPWILP